MAKQYFKPGNMLYPLPAVMVSCQYPAGKEDVLCTNPDLAGKPNIITVAWAGTICTNPKQGYKTNQATHSVLWKTTETKKVFYPEEIILPVQPL